MSSNKMPEQYSLKWNNFHANLTTGFHGLFEDEDLVDVSLAVEGKIIQAHKVILSVCSPYFKSLFRIHPEKHPIVFLKDVGYSEVIGLLQFMYQGQVDVSQEQLAEFLRVAEMLQVKGLTSNSESDPSNNSMTSDLEPMIPLPVLSTLSNKVNNISNNNGPSQNNALKRKKPPPTSSIPMDSCEPIFKIVSVESLKKPKLISEDASAPASTNGISSMGEQDANCDSPSPQGDLPLTPTVQMIPKMEPVEEYNESSFTDYSDIGENFMSHFMEEPSSDTSPQPPQQNYSSFTPDTPPQQATKPSASTPSPAASSDSSPTTGTTPVNKLTSQQIMNIDVSLLQEPSRDLSLCEVAQIISRKLFYRGHFYRREKMTYNKKLMWKCVCYSRLKCHSRVHTFDGYIIYSSDTHNHPPPNEMDPFSPPVLKDAARSTGALESGKSKTPESARSDKARLPESVRSDGTRLPEIAKSDSSRLPDKTRLLSSAKPNKTKELFVNKNTKLSLTKNICMNLKNITKPRSLTDMVSNPSQDDAVSQENDQETSEELACDGAVILPLVFNSTITEIPNSLGKMTKCAVKQEIVTCTPEIC